MSQLLPTAIGTLFSATRISAATKGAIASITGVNPAAGVSASQLQQEADALSRARQEGTGAPWQSAAGHAPPPPPASETAPEKGSAVPGKGVAAQSGSLTQAGAATAAAAPEETAAAAQPVPDAPLATSSASPYETKIRGMIKALMQLSGAADTGAATALILLSGNGSAAVSVRAPAVTGLRTGSGDDAVAVKGGVITSVSTGGGADAVTLEADVVDGVRTDGGGGSRYRGDWRSWNFSKVQGPRSGSGDSLAVRARHAANLYTGGGDDAIAVQAGTVSNVRAGRGDDAITIEATLVTGIRGGAGDDAITVSAERSLETASREPRWHDGHSGWGAARPVVDVDGGSGNDSIVLETRGSLTARGGTGDDDILLKGGNVALSYRAGDGDDVVTLADGANVVIQLQGAEGYAVTRGEDSLTLNFGDGQSITFRNLSEGGAIAVSQGQDGLADMLHEPQRLDLTM